MVKEIHPWERRTPLDKIVHTEGRENEDKALKERAEGYRGQAEKIVAGEKLATLTRGFLSGCGGIEHVTSAKCKKFVSDFSGPVRKALDTVPEDDLPAAVYALVQAVDKER